MKNFALIGASGYIAPRHMRAIYDTNNDLIAAMDPFDSVGVIDNYFPNSHFFVEFERFDRFINKIKNNSKMIDYFTIASPNYLHDSHIRYALNNEADSICEKPLVLNPWNLESLEKLEKKSGRKIWNILQLRLHKNVLKLKNKIDKTHNKKKYEVDLTYITSRGKWYDISWKGDVNKSGGISTNIGVHFFDMLTWIFGDVKLNKVHIHKKNVAAGFLEFENARVRWFLSIDSNHLPEQIKKSGKKTFRNLTIEGEELEFSRGFDNLHTKIYEDILEGKGFGISEVKKSIDIIHEIRNSVETGIKGDYHPILKKIKF